MIHKSVSLPKADWQALAKAAKHLGISVGELLRRLISEWRKTNV